MRRFVYLLPALLAMLGACTNDPIQPQKGVAVAGHNLPPTGEGFHYRLWFSYPEQKAAIKDPRIDHEASSYFPVGSFRVTDAGALVSPTTTAPATFVIPEGYSPALIADAILTIESNGSTDSLPGPILLAGEFVGSEQLGIDTLTLDGADAFGKKKMEEIVMPENPHRFILNTPTTPQESDFAMGIWFAVLENGRFQSSLSVPVHPINPKNPRWEYEAWLVDNRIPNTPSAPGRYISLGRFDTPAGRDQTGPGPGAGPDLTAAYETPGEDLVAPPGRTLNSGDYGLLISLQPFGQTLERPFVTLLKRDTIPTTLQRIQPDTLAAAENFPRLEVRIER